MRSASPLPVGCSSPNGRGASAEVLAEQTPAFAHREAEVSSVRGPVSPTVERSSWSSITSLHRPTGHTWPEVICCLSRRGLRVSRSSAPMQTTQYGDLQRFFARCLSVATVSCCPFAARKRHARVCPDNKTCYLQALRETGATGLKPA